ncbi:hypothetical protein V8C34DRAFT_297219 [Trichoderma compactum]
MDHTENSLAMNTIDGLENAAEGKELSIVEMLSGARDALRKAQREAAKIQAELATTALQLQDANSNTTIINEAVLLIQGICLLRTPHEVPACTDV